MFSRFKIRTKLMALVVMLTAITCAIAAFGVSRIQALGASIVHVDNIDNAATAGAKMSSLAMAMNRGEYRLMTDLSADFLATSHDTDLKRQAQFETLLKSAHATADAREEQQLKDVEESYAHYKAARAETMRLAAKHEGQAALSTAVGDLTDQIKRSRNESDTFAKTLDTYVSTVDDRGTATAEQENKRAASASVVMIGITFAGVVVGLVGGYLLANFGISAPIMRSVAQLRDLSNGKLDTPITGADRPDECGEIARGLAVFKDNAVKARNMARSVGGIVDTVSSAATEMQATATQLSASALQTSSQSVTVSAAAEEAGSNVTSVASAAEQLGASITEINRQIFASTEISSSAVHEAEKAMIVVDELNSLAASIGDVIGIIAGLASQTNLLALNAAIESARAGEAGKGFAVVASEVKALANQTAHATTDISRKVEQIQASTDRAVTAIQGITTTISDIRKASSSIATAVEQQNAATSEIVQAVTQASVGTKDVTANMIGVSQTAEETGAAATQMLAASSELAVQASRLQSEMTVFLETSKAA